MGVKQEPIIISFALAGGHSMKMILTRLITKGEFETIKKVIELSERGIVEPHEPEDK